MENNEQMTIRQALEVTKQILDGISVPVAMLDQIGAPLRAVAGGVPARPKTWRSAANGVISLKWWDWPEEKLAAAARILMSEDEYLLKKFAEEWKDE